MRLNAIRWNVDKLFDDRSIYIYIGYIAPAILPADTDISFCIVECVSLQLRYAIADVRAIISRDTSMPFAHSTQLQVV